MALNAQDYTYYHAESFPVDESTVNQLPALVIVSGNGEFGIVELTAD